MTVSAVRVSGCPAVPAPLVRHSPDDREEDTGHVGAAAALVVQVGDHHLTTVEAHCVRRLTAGQQTHWAGSLHGHRLVDDDSGRLSVPD